MESKDKASRYIATSANLPLNKRQVLLFRHILTCSRHQSLQIFEFQFSKSLFLLIEGGQENIFYWFSCPPSINKNKDLENWRIGI